MKISKFSLVTTLTVSTLCVLTPAAGAAPPSGHVQTATSSAFPHNVNGGYRGQHCPRGFLCFYNYVEYVAEKVQFDNKNWNAFGWEDRATNFYNNGTKKNVRIYRDRNWEGDSLYIWRSNVKPNSSYLEWAEDYVGVVSSNQWVK